MKLPGITGADVTIVLYPSELGNVATVNGSSLSPSFETEIDCPTGLRIRIPMIFSREGLLFF